MRLRIAYLKVKDIEAETGFWEAFLDRRAHRKSPRWSEFALGEVRLGLLLNDFGEVLTGSACVPVFEFDGDALSAAIERAKRLGASVVLDGLADPNMKSIVLASPEGHEFELCGCHVNG